MNQPGITWLLPVLNCEAFLGETLASLASQTWPAQEVLLWDNGSSDNSLSIARAWIPSRLPGRIIADKPLPLHASLAEMVRIATTSLCARIDADDVCEPHRLATQLSFLEAHPRVAAAGSQISPIDESGRPASLNYSLPGAYTLLLHRLLETNCVSHPSVMFRREAIIAAGNYRRPAPVEDYDLWLRVAARHEVRNLSEQLLRYRVRSSSITHRALSAKSLSDSLDAAWLDNAAVFCGLTDPAAAQRLRKRQSRFAFPALWTIARTFAQRDGLAPVARFTRPSFLRACHAHVSDRDLLTKAFLKLGSKFPTRAE